MSTGRQSVVAALIATLAAGCSSTSGSGSPAPSAHTPQSADQVVAALAARMTTAKRGVVYTAETDPNHLLGRPNGYTSKASFTETRISADKATAEQLGSVELGGSVEVFPDAGGASARMTYIQTLGKSLPALVEYDYASGAVLLRVSSELTPQDAAAYEVALHQVVG